MVSLGWVVVEDDVLGVDEKVVLLEVVEDGLVLCAVVDG